jgi:hypothetical protein
VTAAAEEKTKSEKEKSLSMHDDACVPLVPSLRQKTKKKHKLYIYMVQFEMTKVTSSEVRGVSFFLVFILCMFQTSMLHPHTMKLAS